MSKPIYEYSKTDSINEKSQCEQADRFVNTEAKQPKNQSENEMSHEITLDDEGHLVNHLQWSPEVAQRLADTLDVTLNNGHYQILAIVRQFFEKFQHPPATRPLIKYLQQQLPTMEISNQKLQQMFSTGLVARHVNRISGLPKPPNCL